MIANGCFGQHWAGWIGTEVIGTRPPKASVYGGIYPVKWHNMLAISCSISSLCMSFNQDLKDIQA